MTIIKGTNVETMQIDGAPKLDRIHVFWLNVQPGVGYVTIICYGSAWTAYFGAMSEMSIQQFFARADPDYLVTNMHAPTLKEGKRHEDYLLRIVLAVKDALRQAA